MTVDLLNQLNAAKGKGKRNGGGKGKGSKGKGKGEVVPREWNEMSWSEQWWLDQLWSGNLRTALDEAEGKCHRVQTRPFTMFEWDA